MTYTRALQPTPQVREKVKQRDKWCIFCGRPGTDLMHYKSKGARGLGIEQNLALGCRACHMKLDHSAQGKEMKEAFKRHLMYHYKDWDEGDLVYRR